MIYRQPADATSGPNCGPTSVAVLTGKPLAAVLDLIKAAGDKPGNWKGSTRNRGPRHGGENGDCFKALAALGANPKVETGLEDHHRNRQLRSVVADLPGDRAYFVCTGGHAQAVVDGRVYDQSTAPEGEAVSTYRGRNKRVNVIISVDRLTQTKSEENTIMDNPIAAPSLSLSDAISKVAGFEAVAASSVSAIKGLTGEKNGAKVAAYAHMVAGLIAHKISKGTAQAGEFKAALIEQGVSKACAKRYMENGQKAKTLFWLQGTGSDADAILAAFEENDIRTEQDLVNIFSPKVVLTAAEELAAKAQALTDSDDAALQALLDAAVLINPDCAGVAATMIAALAAHGEATVAQAPLDLAA
jgi:hypothetical protein